MKKKFMVMLALFLSIGVLGACSQKEEKKENTKEDTVKTEIPDGATTRVFVREVNGARTELTYICDGDRVLIQKTKNVTPLSAMNLKTVEEAKAKLEPKVEQYRGVKGIEHSIEYNDPILENISIDYTKVDMEKIKSIPGFETSGDLKNGISMKASSELITKSGFVELKDGATSEKEITRVFVKNQGGFKSELTYICKGDKVIIQKTRNEFTPESIKVKNLEEAKKKLEPLSSKYKGVEGIDYSIKFGKTIVEEVSVEYAKVDYEKAKAIPGFRLTGDPKINGVSMQASLSFLQQAGYTEKK